MEIITTIKTAIESMGFSVWWTVLTAIVVTTLLAVLRKVGMDVVTNYVKKHPTGFILAAVVIPVLSVVVVVGSQHISNDSKHIKVTIDELTDKVSKLENQVDSAQRILSAFTGVDLELKLQLESATKKFISTQISELADAIKCRDSDSC